MADQKAPEASDEVVAVFLPSLGEAVAIDRMTLEQAVEAVRILGRELVDAHKRARATLNAWTLTAKARR